MCKRTHLFFFFSFFFAVHLFTAFAQSPVEPAARTSSRSKSTAFRREILGLEQEVLAVRSTVDPGADSQQVSRRFSRLERRLEMLEARIGRAGLRDADILSTDVQRLHEDLGIEPTNVTKPVPSRFPESQAGRLSGRFGSNLADGIRRKELGPALPDQNWSTEARTRQARLTVRHPASPTQTGAIAGTVTESATPLQDVDVQIYDASGNFVTGATTLADGTYNAGGLSTGDYFAMARKPGYIRNLYNGQPCQFGCNVTSGTSIAVTDGNTTSSIDFSMVAGSRISGNVKNASLADLQSIDIRIYNSVGAQVAGASTDASGNYTTGDGLPTGTYYARTFNGQGYLNELYDNMPCYSNCNVTNGTPISITSPTDATGINFVLSSGGTISGHITDALNAPIPDISVNLYDSNGNYFTSGYTDAGGDYTTADGVPAGTYYAQTSNGQGYMDELYNNIPCLPGCDVTGGDAFLVSVGNTGGFDFQLNQGGTISGTVTDATTLAGIPNVQVKIYNSSGLHITNATTDSLGDYVTGTGLPAGVYFASARRQGYVPELYPNIVCYSCNATTGNQITVNAGLPTVDIDFALDAGGSILGNITDSATSAPLSGAGINVYNSSGNYLTGSGVDPSGNYITGDGLPGGTYYVRSWNNVGYLNELYDNIPCYLNCIVTGGTPVAVTAPDGTTGIDFALSPGGTVSGTITDASSLVPLSNISVQLYDSTGSPVSYGYTDSAGVYTTLDGVPTGTYYARTGNGIGYIDELYDDLPCPFGCTITGGTQISVTSPGDTPNIDFALQTGGSISGNVTDGAIPLSGVQIRLYDSNGSHVRNQFTDAAGNYSATGLPSGSYYLRANAQGFIPELYDNKVCLNCSPTSGDAVVVTVGIDTPGIDFVLSPGGRISGNVSSSLTPLSGAHVDIFNSTGKYVASGTTNALGDYITFDGLPTGSYFALARSQGYRPELYNNIPCLSCDVTSGTPVSVTSPSNIEGISFVLETGGTISGTITDGALPLSGISVNLYNSSGTFVTYGYTDTAGNYTTFDGVPTGTYYARTANGRGYVDELFIDTPCPFTCNVTAGAQILIASPANTPNINFALQLGGSISGNVTDGANPLSGVQIRVFDSTGRDVRNEFTDSAGNYSATGLPSGSYFLQTSAQGFISELYDNIVCLNCDVTTGNAVAVTVGSDTGGINFALSAGVTISGTVTSSLAPLSNISVNLYDSGGNYVTSGATNVAGVYTTFDGIPSGTYFARTSNGQGYLDELYNNIPCPFNCTVTTGTGIVVAGIDITNINFDLQLGGTISGNVTDASAVPIQGVTIQVYDSSGKYVRQTTTATGGNYNAIGLPTGTFYARASHPNYLSEVYDDIPCSFACNITGSTAISVTAGGNIPDVNFNLNAGGVISGIVTDDSTDLPISNALITIFPESGTDAYGYGYGYSDVSGNYTSVEGLPQGTYYVSVSAAGYIPEAYDNLACLACDPTTGNSVSVTVGATTSVDFALTKGGTVSGHVADATTSNALQNIVVRIFDINGNAVTQGRTDSSGNYTTSDGLPTGSYFARALAGQGYISELYDGLPCVMCDVTAGNSFLVTVGVNIPNIDFDLTPGGRISGTVGDAFSSAPLANALVQVFHPNGTNLGNVRTDALGHYTTNVGLSTGNYYVRARTAGYMGEAYDNVPCAFCNPTSFGAAVPVTTGTTITDINFALDKGGSISGKVTDAATSQPLLSVEVDVYNSAGIAMTYGYTDSTGNYNTSVGLPTGTYTAVASINRFGYLNELYNNIPCTVNCNVLSGAPISVTAGLNTPNINIQLGKGVIFSGTVTDAGTSLLVQGAEVQVFDSAGNYQTSGFTNASGEYLTEFAMPAGNYYLLAGKAGYRRQLYDGVECAFGCDVTSGTAVTAVSGTAGGIDFNLQTEVSNPWIPAGNLNTKRTGHTTTLLNDGRVLVAGGFNGGYLAGSEIFDPATGRWTTTTGAMNAARANHTATLLSNGKVLVAGGYNGSYLNNSETFDPATGMWSQVIDTLGAARSDHTAVLLANGKVLISGGFNGSFLASSEVFDPATNLWSATTGPMNRTRRYHTATLLPDGRVLIAGGFNGGYLASCETFNPSSGTWTFTTGSLNTGRGFHTATLLPNDTVLVAGGYNGTYLASSELFNASLGTWSLTTGGLTTGRRRHSATLLPNGSVLAAGGENGATNLLSVELFDPAAGTWSGASSMDAGRKNHTATLLAEGRVLIAGGENASGQLAESAIYEPASPSWNSTDSLNFPRDAHTATLLSDGMVLVAGGNGAWNKSEVYDPSGGGWIVKGDLNTGRARHTATLMSNGKVLVSGGMNGAVIFASAELYNPIAGTWSTAGTMAAARVYHTSTLLADGRVLVTGGLNGTVSLNGCELYNPGTGSWSATGSMNVERNGHVAVLLPNGKVLVAGGQNDSGFLTSAELYDPVAGTWSPTGSLHGPRSGAIISLLPNGKALTAGGSELITLTAGAEIYDPVAGTWSVTGSLSNPAFRNATVLPNGKVLAAGGVGYTSILSILTIKTSEIYDPAAGAWTHSVDMAAARRRHTLTVLNNGRVLAAGGFNNTGWLSSCELFDPGLGFDDAWRPNLTDVTDPLANGDSLTAVGSRFQGISEASGGNGAQNSSSNYPVVQLRRLDNSQIRYMQLDPNNGWSDASFTSGFLNGWNPGPAVATVFTNGIPSSSAYLITAGCALPGSPAITSITDADGCQITGIQINFTAGLGAESHDLLKDGQVVVNGYVSGAVYNPGDMAQHSYTIRAVKANGCTADSGPMTGADAAAVPGAPANVAASDANVCAQDGIQVTFTAGSGATSHNLLQDGIVVVTGYASGTVYNPGDSVTHSYQVRAVNGACVTDSAASGIADASATIQLDPTGPPSATLDQDYTPFAFTASGGAAPYTFSTTDILPAGMTLSAAGVLSGIPTVSGSFNFSVTATDANGCAGIQSYDLIVDTSCLFCDDFEDGDITTPLWTPKKGAWSVVNGAATGTTDRKTDLISPAYSSCTTCSYTATMQASAGGRVSMFAWYTNGANGVEVRLMEDKNKLLIKQKLAGASAKAKAILVIQPDTPYGVEVAYDGAAFHVFVDGTEVATMPGVGTPSGIMKLRVKTGTGLAVTGAFEEVSVK